MAQAVCLRAAFHPHLDSEEMIATFLAHAFASGSDEAFQNALQAAARARARRQDGDRAGDATD